MVIVMKANSIAVSTFAITAGVPIRINPYFISYSTVRKYKGVPSMALNFVIPFIDQW